ncbi:MAG: hypothetical protein Q4E02_05065 [Lagierella massiliensis]|nr:hypothetical protein [Lagierella massiliensis]
MEDRLYIKIQRLIHENDKTGLSDYNTQFYFGSKEDVDRFDKIIEQLYGMKDIKTSDEHFTIKIKSSNYSIEMKSPLKYDRQIVKIEKLISGTVVEGLKFVEIDREKIKKQLIDLVNQAKIEEVFPSEIEQKHPHVIQGGFNPPNKPQRK